MKTLEGCIMCLSIEDKEKVSLAESTDLNEIIPVVKRIVQKTANFIAFESLGQIAEGHTLIAPREHYSCLGALPEPLFDELIELKQELGARIAKNYFAPIYFEHGVIGQTESHAHLHIIPAIPAYKSVDSSDIIYQKFIHDFSRMKQIDSLKELKDIWKNKGVYLYYESPSKSQYVFHTNIFPMYARYVISESLNVPQRANWRAIPRYQDNNSIRNAVKKLKNI